MFAGAAFTDQADISQTEAVDMLSALGVIQGYEDGSFKPDATITRAEAAKMIYTIRNGGNDNASAFAGKSVFTDVYNGHWAEGYINFCYTNGIIAGNSSYAMTFGPDDSVTGTELAKMLLICMGYQADRSGLTGAGWDQKTNALASENGLYDDVTASVSAAMPRQFAAQIMYNALEADTVTWSTDSNSYEKTETTGLESREVAWDENGNATQIQYVSVTKNETMGKKWMGLDKIEDVMLTAIEKEDGRETYSLNGGDYTRVVNDYSGLLGQRVNILIKDNDTSKVYGVYADEDSKVLASGTVGQLEDTSASNKTKLNGTEYKLENASATSTSYTETQPNNKAVLMPNVGYSDADNLNVETLEKADTVGMVAGTVRLIDNNNNGKADVVLYIPAEVGQLTYVGNQSVTINNSIGSQDLDDIDIYDDYAKDDWVTYTADTYTITGDASVQKIDVVTAEVTSMRSSSNEVRVDGTWYKVASNQSGDTIKTGSTYDLAIVGNYIVNADETEASSSDVLFLADYSTTLNGNMSAASTTQDVKAYFLDGTSKTITVESAKLANHEYTDEDYDIKSNNNTIGSSDVNKLYTYSVKSNGNYELEILDNSNKAGYDNVVALKNGSIDGDQKIDKLPVADDAVMFIAYGGNGSVKSDIKVLSGKSVNDWEDAYGSQVAYATTKSNGIEYVKVGVIVAEAEYAGATTDYQYGYMISDSYEDRDSDNNKVTAFEIWTGSEVTTVYADSTAASIQKEAGEILAYAVDGDYIDVKTVNVAKVAITGLEKKSEGNVVVAGEISGIYAMDEDCVYIAINDDKQEGMEGSSLDQIALAEKTADEKAYYANAYIVYSGAEGSQKIVAIIYDADNNRLDGNIVVD